LAGIESACMYQKMRHQHVITAQHISTVVVVVVVVVVVS
jgi:hypothetical protein